MKKISLILFITIISVGACRKEKNPEDIQNQIFEYKQKTAELQKQLKKQNKTDISEHYVNVRVDELKREELTHYIRATAYVKAKEQAYVSPEMNGQIKKIYVKEGQYVKKGQLLVTLNATVIRSSIEEVKTGLKLATVMYEKQKELWEQKVGKELDYLQAKNKKESLEAKINTLKAQLELTVIKAPIPGIVDEIYLKEGEPAAPGRQVINLVNLRKMEAVADVSEKYVPYVHKGDSVVISFPSYPGLIIKTKISRTGNVINPVNRTFKVQADFINKDNKIKPNMVAELQLSDYKGSSLAIPSVVVKKDRKGEYVFTAEKNGDEYTAQKRYIKTSYIIGDKVMVTEGLNVGDKVIVEGYNMVVNKQKIKIK